jgi:cytochrome c556
MEQPQGRGAWLAPSPNRPPREAPKFVVILGWFASNRMRRGRGRALMAGSWAVRGLRMRFRWSFALAALAAAAAFGVAAVGSAEAPAAPSAPPAVAPQSLDDVVAGRRAAYFLSGALLSDMRMAAERGTSVKDQEFAAKALANWARTLPRMFPPNTLTSASHANPNVWTDRPGFEAKAHVYAEEAGKLAQFAAADDRTGFLQQIKVVHEACDSCHRVYHRKEEPTDGKK